jgi:Peptidase M50B-like
MTVPSWLDTMLSRVGETQTPLPPPIAVAIGMLVFIAVLGPALWKIAIHAETVVHEAAHAMVGIVTGRRISSVKINPNGSGATAIVPPTGFGYGVAAFVGYVGASAAGLLAAWMISMGRIVAVLWVGGLLLAIMVLLVRNLFGGIVVLACGALLYLIVRYTTAGVETAVAYGLTWFLLLSAPKRAWRCEEAEGCGGCKDPRRDDVPLAVGVVLPVGDRDDRRSWLAEPSSSDPAPRLAASGPTGNAASPAATRGVNVADSREPTILLQVPPEISTGGGDKRSGAGGVHADG